MTDAEPLGEADVAADPLVQFRRWFEAAAPLVRMPEAVALATADGAGRPSARMVLVKGWDERGFVFYTNYQSRKAADLDEDPHAAMLFYWDPLGRQVRIEGPVGKVGDAESDRYFATRPPGAQIGAHASHQSRPLEGRDQLDRRVQELIDRFAGEVVPRPAWWGGYRLRPDSFEFWQNRQDRLHDRLRFTRGPGGGWALERLQP